MVTRDQIVDEARKWLGVRWRHQGRSREHGIDCAGLIVKVSHALGLSDFDTMVYTRTSDGQQLLALFREHMGSEKPVRDRQPGDALILRESVYPLHCGVVSLKKGAEHLIHSNVQYRKVTEDRLSYFMNRVTHCFAFPGVADG